MNDVSGANTPGPDFQAAAHQLAEAFAADQLVAQQRAVLHAEVDTESASYVGGGRDLFDPLDQVREAIVPAGSEQSVTIELVAEQSGNFQLATSSRLTRSDFPELGYLLVFDPGHRPPESLPLQDDTENVDASPSGDPLKAAELYAEFVERWKALLPGSDPVNPPASAEAIAALEQQLGVSFPADLRALYTKSDGENGIVGVFLGWGWLRLDRISWNMDEPFWSGWELDWDKIVPDANPPGRVRRLRGSPQWIPFAEDGGGNFLAVDLVPGPKGRIGQVIAIGRDYDGPKLEADSVTELLALSVRCLREERYSLDDEYLEFLPPDREIAPTAGPQRFASLNTASPSELTLLRDLPIETLHITVDETAIIDLDLLNGHPTLRSLEITGGQPIDLTPLTTMPAIHGLSLSKAQVRNIQVLAQLPSLRYLSLSFEQWHDLSTRLERAEPARLLPNLAAAQVVGDRSLIAAEQWADDIAPDTANTDPIRLVYADKITPA